MRNRVSRKYGRAIAGLYGKQFNLAGIPTAGRSKYVQSGQNERSEDDEQIIVHFWAEKKGIVHHHSPNGGRRDLAEGAKFRRMGVSAGYPDLTIPYARKGYHGLYIELKRVSGGKLSDAQAWWRDFLVSEGHAWHLAKGADEAIKIICDYMEIAE